MLMNTARRRRTQNAALGRLIGLGGTSEVFLAERGDAGGARSLVALKRMRQDQIKFIAQPQPLYEEAALGMRLCHRNIVQVLDLLEIQGQLTLVLEYIDGPNLRQLLVSGTENGSPFTVEQALHLAISIAEALEAAWCQTDESGRAMMIAHLDIKPENVMVSSRGIVKVIDFGISRSLQGDGKGEGTLRGTPQYLSPEQAMGLDCLGAPSDMFSLGSTLYELLTGRPLFSGDRLAAVVAKVARAEVCGRLDLLPREAQKVRPVLERLLARDPEQRYASMTEVLHWLRNLASGGPTGTELEAQLELLVHEWSLDDSRLHLSKALETTLRSSGVHAPRVTTRGGGDLSGKRAGALASTWPFTYSVEGTVSRPPARANGDVHMGVAA